MTRDDLRIRLKGPIASLVTPFDDEGRIAARTFAQEIGFLSAAGIEAFACNASLGEFASLTVPERKQVLESMLKHAPDKGLVLAGCASSDVATTVELAAHAASQGTHGIILTAPYYFKSTGQELLEFFTAIDGKISVPWVLYNNPSTTKTDVPLDVIDQLSRLKHFVGVKEASGDMVRYYEARERFASAFPLIAAAESVLVFQLLAGAEGVMTAGVTFAPALMKQLWHAASEHNTEQVFALFSRIFQVRKLMRDAVARGFPAFVPYTKAALEIQGVPVGRPRTPLSPLTAVEKNRLADVLSQVLGRTPAWTANP